MHSTPERRSRWTEYIRRLPFAGKPKDIPESRVEINAVMHDLRREQPELYDALQAETQATSDEVRRDLEVTPDGVYVLDSDQLFGVMARFARMGAALTASALGKAQSEIHALEQINHPPQATGGDAT